MPKEDQDLRKWIIVPGNMVRETARRRSSTHMARTSAWLALDLVERSLRWLEKQHYTELEKYSRMAAHGSTRTELAFLLAAQVLSNKS